MDNDECFSIQLMRVLTRSRKSVTAFLFVFVFAHFFARTRKSSLKTILFSKK
jgi:hypothetical protein